MTDRRPSKLIDLDGRTLEGGGQLLRNALCLAALTSQSVRITNIRGNRSGGGGLKAQHLACVKWLAHATNAHVQGAERGSRTLLFEPGTLEAGISPAIKKISLPNGQGQIYQVRVDVETAGSTGLVLQAVLPYVLFTRLQCDLPVRLVLSGGTNVSGSPSYEYIAQVLLPMLHTIGFPKMTSTIHKRGWSQGGSSVGGFSITIPSRRIPSLSPFQLKGPKKGEPTRQIKQLTATLLAPTHCHDHFRRIILPLIQRYFTSTSSPTINEPTITCEDSGHDKRLYLIIVAEIPLSTPTSCSQHSPHAPLPSPQPSIFLARDHLYSRKLPTSGGHMRATTEMAEKVTAELFFEYRSGACVDEHMRDQLAIFQAVAVSKSTTYYQTMPKIFPGVQLRDDDDEEEVVVVDGEDVCEPSTLPTSRESLGIAGSTFDGSDKDEFHVVPVVAGRRLSSPLPRPPSLHAQTADWVCSLLLPRSGDHAAPAGWRTV